MKMKFLMMMSIFATMLQFTPHVFAQNDEQPMGKHRWEQRLANLSPEERQKFRAARQKAMQEPSVQAAHEKMRQAHKEFRDAMHAAHTRIVDRNSRRFGILESLRDSLADLRMLSAGTVLQPLARVVRDGALLQSKEAELVVSGADVALVPTEPNRLEYVPEEMDQKRV